MPFFRRRRRRVQPQGAAGQGAPQGARRSFRQWYSGLPLLWQVTLGVIAGFLVLKGLPVIMFSAGVGLGGLAAIILVAVGVLIVVGLPLVVVVLLVCLLVKWAKGTPPQPQGAQAAQNQQAAGPQGGNP